MHWILDFDDTLALGPDTWALQTVMPQLAQEYQMPFDAALFAEVTLKAQEQTSMTDDDEAVIRYVFESLKWDIALKDELINRVYNEFQPHLFEETIPFLESLVEQGDMMLIVSNNNYTPYLAEQMGISKYFKAIFTPKVTQKRRKPHPDMWEDVKAIIGDVPLCVVGDDPWSDALFAQANPQATAYIIDRLGRYQSLHDTNPAHFVSSLTAILETLPRN
jgi:FMN phosphatase YigB (HAD superfamily)